MSAAELIDAMIREKSTATPQDVAACLAASPQMVNDIGTLEALKKIRTFDDLSLRDGYGSVWFTNFRPDWSCDSRGYGYRGIVEDIRKGFHAACLSTDHGNKLRLSSRVS